MKLSSLTTEYLHCSIESDINPTSDTVKIAFMASGSPTSDDWHTATWESGSSSPYTAKILVGATGVSLAVGTYVVWIKVTDSPEIPVKEYTERLVIY